MGEEIELKIREASINDYNSIKSLVFEVYKLHLENRPDVYVKIDNPLEKQKFNEILDDENVRVLVVENTKNKEILAYSIVKIMKPLNPMLIQKSFMFIDDVCVTKACKRKGIGKLLFEHIVNFAKQKGVSSIRLNVWEFNKAAFKFYKKMGMSTRNRMMELEL